MTEMRMSFHAASSLCHILSTVSDGKGWWASLKVTYDHMFSVGDRSRDRVAEYPVYQGRSKHDVQHMVLRNLVGSPRLTGF